MTDARNKSPRHSRVIGSTAFAAISAVEGLELGAESRKRLARLRSSGISQDERRSAVLHAYRSPRASG